MQTFLKSKSNKLIDFCFLLSEQCANTTYGVWASEKSVQSTTYGVAERHFAGKTCKFDGGYEGD